MGAFFVLLRNSIPAFLLPGNEADERSSLGKDGIALPAADEAFYKLSKSKLYQV